MQNALGAEEEDGGGRASRPGRIASGGRLQAAEQPQAQAKRNLQGQAAQVSCFSATQPALNVIVVLLSVAYNTSCKPHTYC